MSQFSLYPHTSNDPVTTASAQRDGDILVTMLVYRLAICVLLSIDPSHANDKSNTMLIAPSYNQNPLLRKEDKNCLYSKYLQSFFRQLLSNYHENYNHFLEPPEKSIKVKETLRKTQLI